MSQLRLETAHFSKRLFAYNIDITLLLALVFPLSRWIADDRLFYGLSFALACLYHVIAESSRWQGTVGKRYTGMKVIDANTGQSLSFFKAFLRFFAKLLSLMLCFAGFFMIYFRSDRKGLHDLMVGARVVLRR